MISSLSGVAPSFHSNSSGTRAFGPSAAPVSMDLQCRQSFRSGGNQSPASLSRSIDKVLEESQYTGEINLSGRKLKEYPQTAINYDLIDTTATDLSRNRLHEVPAQVCNYHSLERLVCYHNVIRSISSNISQLQNLVYLDICRNQLSLLPTTLCQLEQLQVLLASNNRLVSLPEEIGLLHQLMQLDVSSNQITQLPVQLGELSKLQTLNVSHNQLVELPLSLSLLKLLSLDVSSNRISNIPTEFRNIDTLDELQLDSNPLVSPPAHICRKGLSHVMKHLRVTAERDERKRGVLQQQQQYDYRGNTNSNNLSGPGNTASLNRRRLSAQNSSSPLITTKTSISNMQPEVGAAPVSGHQRLTTQLSQGTRDSGYSSTADVRQVGGSGEEGKRRGRGDKGSLTSSSSAQELHRQKSEYEEKKRKAGLLKKSIEEEERRKESRSRQHRTDPQSSSNRPSSRTDGQTVPPDDISSYSLYSRAVASPPQVSPPHNLTTPPINHDINYSASSESLRSNTSCRSTSSGSEATSPLSNDRSERAVPVHVESSDWSGGGVSSAQNIITIPVNHVSTSSRRSSDSRSNQSTPTPYNDRDLKSNHEAMVAQHWLEAQSVRQKFEEERVRMRRNFMERMPMDRFFDNNSSILGSRNRGTETQTNGGSGMTSSGAYQNDTQNFTSNRIPVHYQNSEELKQSSDPAFTVRCTAQQEQAEREITDELRKTIESMLQMKLPSSPDDLSMALKDGVVLCHLVNHVRPRSVASIHVPSPAVPKLSLPKCRRNVDNFLLACRRIGVESNQLCSAAGILEERELLNLSFTIRALLQCSGLSLPKQSSV